MLLLSSRAKKLGYEESEITFKWLWVLSTEVHLDCLFWGNMQDTANFYAGVPALFTTVYAAVFDCALNTSQRSQMSSLETNVPLSCNL